MNKSIWYLAGFLFIVIISLSIIIYFANRRISNLEEIVAKQNLNIILIADSVSTAKNAFVQHQLDSSNFEIENRITSIKFKSNKQDAILNRIDSIGYKPPIL